MPSRKKTIKGGWVTYVGKGCTEYGIAYTATTLAGYVLRDESISWQRARPFAVNMAKTVSLQVYLPWLVKNGVEKVVELSLTDTEKRNSRRAARLFGKTSKKPNPFGKKPNGGTKKLSPKKVTAFSLFSVTVVLAGPLFDGIS